MALFMAGLVIAGAIVLGRWAFSKLTPPHQAASGHDRCIFNAEDRRHAQSELFRRRYHRPPSNPHQINTVGKCRPSTTEVSRSANIDGTIYNSKIKMVCREIQHEVPVQHDRRRGSGEQSRLY